jgi:hypothetical protein
MGDIKSDPLLFSDLCRGRHIKGNRQGGRDNFDNLYPCWKSAVSIHQGRGDNKKQERIEASSK